MTRHVTREVLHAYLDGDLPWDEKRRVREHVEACPTCKAELERLRWAEHALRHMATFSVPDTFAQEVMQRVRAQDAAHTSMPATWLWTAHALVVTGLVLLLLAVWEVLAVMADVFPMGPAVDVSDPARLYELIAVAALQMGETAIPLALGLLALGLFLEVSRWLPWAVLAGNPKDAWERGQTV